VIKDVSILTSIPEKTLTKLNEKVLFTICETIQEDMLADNPITELDFGLFTLYIKHEGSEVAYRIIPSSDMEKSITATIKNKMNLLEDTLNTVLANKFINIYKDIC
jgi:hypothetical protein